IDTAFGRDGAWGTWTGQWTAEEGRHSLAMRDYLLLSRGVDPVQLERDRMQQMKEGYHGDLGKGPLNVLAYVSFQELATRIAHRNTGTVSNDRVANKLMARIAADENLHMIFYRDLLGQAMDLTPSQVIPAIVDEVVGFQMPGFGISDFGRKAAIIAKAGIYDLRIHHDDVVMPLLRYWKIFELTGLGEVGETARQELADFLKTLNAQASRFEERRDAAAARAAARGVPAV
ncbi:MAG: acyl-[acyl-carrier-protein] desaturase, partial [Actinomycetota bacterium]|nr:acyl-[acyl-carrier-protein] desaturase [Actinomycetota bacterium]